MSLEELRAIRLEKLKILKEAGMDPYPAHSNRTNTIAEVLHTFQKISVENKHIVLAGRVRAIRGHGGSAFLDMDDGSERMQFYLKKDIVGDDSYTLFMDAIDVGDFIEAAGTVFVTKKNEQTLEIASWRVLAKSIRPLPEKWHGIQDIEERLRKRYLDILFHSEVREMVEQRARFWYAMRSFLAERGFLEVETPVLETKTGGADARPFVTHHNALAIDVFLRVSCGELWQKELMVAGFPKVFEIGRIFRNEGISAEHLQDYTQMELYWAYADYEDGMKLAEELYKYVARETFGTLQFTIGEFTVDLDSAWKRYDYRETVKEYVGIDVLDTTVEEVEAKLAELDVEYDKESSNLTRAVDALWKHCRRSIAGPAFLINVPVFLEPLAKRKHDNARVVERFQVLLAGSEMGKGYSELNDPVDQRGRFEEQQRLREAGDDAAQMANDDFVEALEYGMPPTCGFGVSERLFSFLSNKPVRETQIFPLMRPKE